MSRTTQQSGRTPDGRSSIYRGNDGAWHGYVTMGVRPDGRPDRRHRRGKTEAEVTRKVRELEGKRDAGAASRTGRVPTVAQWMRIYIDDVAPLRVSQSTIDSTYRPKIERWIIPRLGKHRLDRLLPEHLYSFYASLKAEGLAPNALDCTKHASSCPKRVGGWTFARPKGGRKRAVPIPPELVEPLHQHLASQDAERQAAADAWDGRDLVWCGPEGQPIDPHDDWEEWKALLAEAGITKDARLHDARHTAGTLLGEQHVDMHVIQRILGHAQVTTTRIYTEPTDPLTREAASLIGKALWPSASQSQPALQPEAGS